MFDSFYFKFGTLPDNKVKEDVEFQTKSLDCDLDVYHVNNDLTVTKSTFDNGKMELTDKPINCIAIIYSHEFLYDNEKDLTNRKYLGCKYQEYDITIKDSKIIYMNKTYESGYEPI